MNFLCLEIVNSDRVNWRHMQNRQDMLDDVEWLHALSEQWGVKVELPASGSDVDSLKKLRASMQAVMSCLDSQMEECEARMREVDAVLAGVPIRIGLVRTPGGFALEEIPSVCGWPLFIWKVAQSFAAMLARHDVSRLKTCANEDCGWAFYDQSKNKARRWCDDKVCGNIMKVRRFRARRKSEPAL